MKHTAEITEGIFMPDFTNCENDEFGNSYCYDIESGEVYRIRLEKIPEKTIPQEVLIKLLRKVSQKQLISEK